MNQLVALAIDLNFIIFFTITKNSKLYVFIKPIVIQLEILFQTNQKKLKQALHELEDVEAEKVSVLQTTISGGHTTFYSKIDLYNKLVNLDMNI